MKYRETLLGDIWSYFTTGENIYVHHFMNKLNINESVATSPQNINDLHHADDPQAPFALYRPTTLLKLVQIL